MPVVPATTSSVRSKAPVRSSSLTASAARDAASGAESSPTYTRIGTLASVWLNSVSCATEGPRDTKLRPSMPRLSQDTNDAGEPEDSGSFGWVAPALVLALVPA